ncbi:CLUMA_CG013654, isoform A [Clunio marinus]|uniref:CLUMA_CG013654, isoform A n=1 Tax=Clunio marinus TaxID=568069 RepID=A0A1J1IKU3_9DIPT|nr:CLUMA_CG013654, isoform A [Clunio marinus]
MKLFYEYSEKFFQNPNHFQQKVIDWRNPFHNLISRTYNQSALQNLKIKLDNNFAKPKPVKCFRDLLKAKLKSEKIT